MAHLRQPPLAVRLGGVRIADIRLPVYRARPSVICCRRGVSVQAPSRAITPLLDKEEAEKRVLDMHPDSVAVSQIHLRAG